MRARGVLVVPGVQERELGEVALRLRLGCDSGQPGIDACGGTTAVTDRHRDRAFAGYDVASGEHAGVTGGHRVVGPHHTVVDVEPVDVREQRQVGLLAEREDEGVGGQDLGAAGGLGEAGLVELHLLDSEVVGVDVVHRGEPAEPDAFLLGFAHLVVVRRHPVTRAAVDDQCVGGAEPLRRTRRVDRGVAAAVDRHAATEQRDAHPPRDRAGPRPRRGRGRPSRRGCRRVVRPGRRRRGRRRRTPRRPWSRTGRRPSCPAPGVRRGRGSGRPPRRARIAGSRYRGMP